MADLDALIRPFLEVPFPLAQSAETPFSYEPISLPARAFAASLLGYETEVAALQAMDATPQVPAFLTQPAPLAPNILDTFTLAEAGANITTQLAALRRGLNTLAAQPDTPEVHWHLGLGGHVWENLALLRAGKALVYTYFQQQNQPVFVVRLHARGLATAMSEADGYTNVLRLSTIALCAHIEGVDTLYLPPFAAEASALETLRHRIHAVAEHESLVHAYGPAQQGAYWPTLLAARLLRAAYSLAASGANLHAAAADTLAQKRADVLAGKRVWVGQTLYTQPNLTIPGPASAATTEWLVV